MECHTSGLRVKAKGYGVEKVNHCLHDKPGQYDRGEALSMASKRSSFAMGNTELLRRQFLCGNVVADCQHMV